MNQVRKDRQIPESPQAYSFENIKKTTTRSKQIFPLVCALSKGHRDSRGGMVSGSSSLDCTAVLQGLGDWRPRVLFSETPRNEGGLATSADPSRILPARGPATCFYNSHEIREWWVSIRSEMPQEDAQWCQVSVAQSSPQLRSALGSHTLDSRTLLQTCRIRSRQPCGPGAGPGDLYLEVSLLDHAPCAIFGLDLPNFPPASLF